MSERKPPPGPALSTRGKNRREAREARLAAALRENLKRRKARSRARDEAGRKMSGDEKPDRA